MARFGAGVHPAHSRNSNEPPKSFIDAAPAAPAQRVVSVDALRGFNIIWILGGDGAIWALADMLHGKGPVASGIGDFLGATVASRGLGRLHVLRLHLPAVHLHHRRRHRAVAAAPGRARGHGAGARARAAARAAALRPRADLLRRHQPALGRTSAMSACCNASRICYLFASLLFLNLNLRGMVAAFVALLVGYWALMTFVPVPGIGAGSFAPGCQSRQLDRRALSAGPAVGQDARSGRAALEHAAGDRHLSARRVRRLAAEERADCGRSRNRCG